MVYILNSILKDNKKCALSLTGCFGLGTTLSQQICDLLGISRNIKLNKLTNTHRSRLVELISQNYQIGTLLKRDIKKHKTRLVSVSCYRGFRLSRGLPCRGQRTHGNSRTCRKHNKI